MRRLLGLLSLVVIGCSSDDPTLERRGDPIPDPVSDGGSASVSPEGGAANGDAVTFCEALSVIRSKCQRCHGDPLKNGAPVPFLTYEDTQATYSVKTGQKWSDVMLSAVSSGEMPYVALNDSPGGVTPPVQPLTDAEKTTLLGWLEQGAKPVGGTDCAK
jgi:hypothetical protein